MATSVLMVGPGKDIIGGITTLVETILPGLEKKVDLIYFSTVANRPLKASGKFSAQNIILAFLQYARFLSVLFRSRPRPQVVHIHTSQGIAWLKDTFYVIISKFYGVYVVLHIHAADYDDLYGSKNTLIQAYTRWVMRMADAVIAVSDEWRQRLMNIVPDGRVYTFTNCISSDSFSPTSIHRLSNGVRALFMGSIGPRKGAFDLIVALGRLKSRGCVFPVWIAGYEEREGDLPKAQIQLEELHLAESCKLTGAVLGEKKAELFEKTNLFILPSYNEGLPMAILEAMTAGMAVVSTPVGGIPEVVRDGYNGFLVQPGNIDALAEKLEILVRDPKLCQIMGQRSREIIERELDVKPYVERLVLLYRTVLQSQS